MRVSLLTALAAPALAGCAQLFGIDDTSGVPDAPPADLAQLALTRAAVGATVVTSPLALAGQTASFLTPDPNNASALVVTPGTLVPPNTWTAKVDGNPLVEFTVPQTTWEHAWAFPSRAVHGHVIDYADPTPILAPKATNEVLNVRLPTPFTGSETFQVYVVGAWMAHTLLGGELPPTDPALGDPSHISATIPFSTFAPAISGNPAAGIQPSDFVLVLRHLGNDLTAVYQFPGFMQSTTMDMIGDGTQTLMEVVHDQTLTATIAPAMLQTRLSAVRPAMSGLGMSWSLTAAPGSKVNALGGPLLHAGTPGTADTMVSATYGNPFVSLGWNSVLFFIARESRTITVSGLSTSAFASLVTIADPKTVTMLDAPSPLPEQITIDRTQLNSDGVSVMLASNVPHVVTMVLESSPAATSYSLTVVELVRNTAGTAIERHTALEMQSNTSTFTIPPGIFKPGSTYLLTAGTLNGAYPNAASGDLDTVAPHSYAQVDSGTFTVMP